MELPRYNAKSMHDERWGKSKMQVIFKIQFKFPSI